MKFKSLVDAAEERLTQALRGIENPNITKTPSGIADPSAVLNLVWEAQEAAASLTKALKKFSAYWERIVDERS